MRSTSSAQPSNFSRGLSSVILGAAGIVAGAAGCPLGVAWLCSMFDSLRATPPGGGAVATGWIPAIMLVPIGAVLGGTLGMVAPWVGRQRSALGDKPKQVVFESPIQQAHERYHEHHADDIGDPR